MRREQSAIRWFALILILALGVSACAEWEAATDTGPEVRLRVGGETYSEPVYSYCWPQSDENVACDVDLGARAQPEQLVPIAPGEPIEVDLSTDDPQPQSLTVTLLDGPGGQTDLTAMERGAAYTAPTEPGQYRIQVDAQYADVNGSEAYVSYVFGLDVVGEAVAAAPTEATADATEVATEAATEEPTEEPTAPPTEAPTLTPTTEPTETPTPLPSPTVAPTLTPSDEPAEEPTEEPAAAITDEPSDEPTDEPTEEATEAATDEPTDEPEPTRDVAAAGVSQVTDEPTEEATEEPDPTETSTARPSATARATAQPTVAEEEPTEAPTDDVETAVEMTDEPTEDSAEEPTPEVRVTPTSQPTAAPEDTPTPEETPEATPEDTGDLGEVALVGNVRIVEDRRTIPLTDAVVTFTYQPADDAARGETFEAITDETGRFVFDPIELNEDDTVLLTISAPGYATQEIELSGADAYALPVINLILLSLAAPTPEPTAIPTATPTAVQPTVTPPAAEELQFYPSGAPRLSLYHGGRYYEPLGYQLCRPDDEGVMSDCVPEPTGTASTRRVALMWDGDAQLQVTGDRPIDIRIEYLTETGVQTGQPEQRPGDNIILFHITPEPGNYTLAVRVTWEDMQVTYYYRVTVSG